MREDGRTALLLILLGMLEVHVPAKFQDAVRTTTMGDEYCDAMGTILQEHSCLFKTRVKLDILMNKYFCWPVPDSLMLIFAPTTFASSSAVFTVEVKASENLYLPLIVKAVI